MTYAPVCIPTLNRYEHLRKCLESLSRCTWADRTEVYVALDYPPANQWDKYAPGWEKNREFLRSCGDMGFKKLHVIEREENYGIWLPGHKGNSRCLLKFIMSKYDRYIFTEDDNIFSPCFLEYMNKGLELFKDDNQVLSLGGFFYNDSILINDNTYLRLDCDYTPWGVGCWTHKEKCLPTLNYQWFRAKVSPSLLIRIKSLYGWGVMYSWVLHMMRHKYQEAVVDNYLWTYLPLTGRQQIIPTNTLVRNIGMDDSGCNCTVEDGTGEWCHLPMNINEHFEFIGTGYEHFEKNRIIYTKGKYWHSDWYYIKRILKLFVKIFILNKSAD